MKPIITILFVILVLDTSAQKIRFTNTTNQWETISVNGDGCHFQTYFSYSTDTIIHGITYKKMHGSGSGYFGYHYMCSCGMFETALQYYYGIREDTMAGKVYYIDLSLYPSDTLEHLLYNYNLNVGDSINYTISGGGTYTDTVVSIDSTLINGFYHKILNMEGKMYGASIRSYTVLEGVGCTNNPLFLTFFGGCFEYGESLVCFYENGILPAAHAPINSCAPGGVSCPPYFDGSIFDNITNCGSLLSVKTTNQQTIFPIIPNPATDHIDITSDRLFTNNAAVTVYDMTCRAVYRTHVDNQNLVNINTSSWPDGLYMVIVQDNSGIVKKEKVVVQH